MTATAPEPLPETEPAGALSPESIVSRARYAWWLVAALPIALGGAVTVLVVLGWLPNPVLYLRASLASFAMVCGGLLSGLWLAWLLAAARVRRRGQRDYQRLRRQAAAERSRFLHRLHHQFKTALVAIRFGMTSVRSHLGEHAPQKNLATIEAQVVRLGQLTDSLRKLANLETEPLERAPVSVAPMLEEVVAAIEEQPAMQGRKVTRALPQTPLSLPQVLGDRRLLMEAVYNLLDNACKFTRAGDTVEIHAFEDGSAVRIDVSDTGPGIPEDELPHLGEELFRGAGARGVPGSGLGLALVRAIAERHGGTLAVRSKVGEGTMMTLRLPAR